MQTNSTASTDAPADLSGRRILITGSTRGIGRGLAATLAERGARVAIHGRDADAAERVAEEIGAGAVGIAAAIGDAAAARDLVARADEAMGGIDGLVNNAGIARIDDSLELDAAAWNEVLATNLSGTFFCAQAAAARMLAADGGAIVNVASIVALGGFPGRAAYAASKSGVVGLTRVLGVEWGPRVRVNAVAPGYVFTDPIKRMSGEGKMDLKAIEQRVPAGRLARVEEVAATVAFLLSDGAAYISGAVLPVDGGWLANTAA